MQHGTPRAFRTSTASTPATSRTTCCVRTRTSARARASSSGIVPGSRRGASILRGGRQRTRTDVGGGGIGSTRSTRSRVRGERLRRRADGGKETSGHAPPRRRDEGRTAAQDGRRNKRDGARLRGRRATTKKTTVRTRRSRSRDRRAWWDHGGGGVASRRSCSLGAHTREPEVENATGARFGLDRRNRRRLGVHSRVRAPGRRG